MDIEGISHATFVVQDLDRMARLMCEGLGGREVYDSLRKLGVEIKPPRPRVEGEGQSLYFYDFDKHLFELHTGTLAQRLQRYVQ